MCSFPHPKFKQLRACEALGGSDTACHLRIKRAPRASPQLLCQRRQPGSPLCAQRGAAAKRLRRHQAPGAGVRRVHGCGACKRIQLDRLPRRHTKRAGRPPPYTKGATRQLRVKGFSLHPPCCLALLSRSCTVLPSLPGTASQQGSPPPPPKLCLHHTLACEQWHQCASTGASHVAVLHKSSPA